MRRDMVKTLSYGSIHFAVAFGVAYLLTGSLPIATGIALIEPLANTVAYFLHERAWNRLAPGREDDTGAAALASPARA